MSARVRNGLLGSMHFFFLNLSFFCCTGSYSIWNLWSSLWHLVAASWHVGFSSPTRDQTQAPSIGSPESQLLDHQGSPWFNALLTIDVISQGRNRSVLITVPKCSLLLTNLSLTLPSLSCSTCCWALHLPGPGQMAHSFSPLTQHSHLSYITLPERSPFLKHTCTSPLCFDHKPFPAEAQRSSQIPLPLSACCPTFLLYPERMVASPVLPKL